MWRISPSVPAQVSSFSALANVLKNLNSFLLHESPKISFFFCYVIMITRTNNILAWWKIGPFADGRKKKGDGKSLEKIGSLAISFHPSWIFFSSFFFSFSFIEPNRLWFFTVNMYLIFVKICGKAEGGKALSLLPPLPVFFWQALGKWKTGKLFHLSYHQNEMKLIKIDWKRSIECWMVEKKSFYQFN